ncbi:MAG TPA: carboxylating nicotinate-nucleotide diphosphorylase [Firmicutes bacterium]|nr:carboxylating nicotinate-nucleotide diphosphorylase [Bacillota bacterium]
MGRIPGDQSEAIDLATLVRGALAEDIAEGDITSLATIPASRMATARLIAKASGVIYGLEIARDVFLVVDPTIRFDANVREGAKVAVGDEIMTLSGPARSLLSAERTALNFLQRLSGIATLSARYVEAVAGTDTKILDTRKTTPGWRTIEKAAVRAGGGHNHRIGLWDMVLIKENHIRAAGSITKAILACRQWLTDNDRENVKIEIETTNKQEIEEALRIGCDRIMLDNMTLSEMGEAVERIRREVPAPEIEASGNMTLDRVRAVAETGVDFISVGAITHSAPVLDLSLLFSS